MSSMVRQGYQVQVYDEFVIRGNTAVLRCQVPSVVRDYVIVTTWEREDGVTIVSNVANGNLQTFAEYNKLSPTKNKIYGFAYHKLWKKFLTPYLMIKGRNSLRKCMMSITSFLQYDILLKTRDQMSIIYQRSVIIS
ncbi:uncharacterized protein CDAR_451981 [Caerostris darwini]|uniref:Ig-like domain-containing protein n=1 Tax=Caerostris darwini TaxID=1538125 RepID=A0AAV4WX54_9ARAC|nr:uncharacterized protein CDAR_451981 [Caerostris darwini]